MFYGTMYLLSNIKQTDKLCLGIAPIFSVARQPKSALGGLISEVSRSYTIRHTHNRQDSSKRVISSTQRPQPTQQTQPTQKTNIHFLSGIRTRDLCSRAAADLRCRPLGHRETANALIIYIILKFRYILALGRNMTQKS